MFLQVAASGIETYGPYGLLVAAVGALWIMLLRKDSRIDALMVERKEEIGRITAAITTQNEINRAQVDATKAQTAVQVETNKMLGEMRAKWTGRP